jgi:hypothetical protein
VNAPSFASLAPYRDTLAALDGDGRLWLLGAKGWQSFERPVYEATPTTPTLGASGDVIDTAGDPIEDANIATR